MAEAHVVDAVLEAAPPEAHIIDVLLEAEQPVVVREAHIIDAVLAAGVATPGGPGGTWAWINGQYVRGRLYVYYDGAYR